MSLSVSTGGILHALWEDRDRSGDFTFICRDGVVKAHRIVINNVTSILEDEDDSESEMDWDADILVANKVVGLMYAQDFDTRWPHFSQRQMVDFLGLINQAFTGMDDMQIDDEPITTKKFIVRQVVRFLAPPVEKCETDSDEDDYQTYKVIEQPRPNINSLMEMFLGIGVCVSEVMDCLNDNIRDALDAEINSTAVQAINYSILPIYWVRELIRSYGRKEYQVLFFHRWMATQARANPAFDRPKMIDQCKLIYDRLHDYGIDFLMNHLTPSEMADIQACRHRYLKNIWADLPRDSAARLEAIPLSTDKAPVYSTEPLPIIVMRTDNNLYIPGETFPQLIKIGEMGANHTQPPKIHDAILRLNGSSRFVIFTKYYRRINPYTNKTDLIVLEFDFVAQVLPS